MKALLIRLNTLGLILSAVYAIFLMVIAIVGLFYHAKPEMLLVTFLGALLIPFLYGLISATLSWLAGSGFKVYVSFK
jgi:hypothetical protein